MSGKREEKRRLKLQEINGYLIDQNTQRENGWTPEAQAAIANYPLLGIIARSPDVMACFKNLESLPEDARAVALDRLSRHDQDATAALAEKPPMPDRAERLSKDAQLAGLIEALEADSHEEWPDSLDE